MSVPMRSRSRRRDIGRKIFRQPSNAQFGNLADAAAGTRGRMAGMLQYTREFSPRFRVNQSPRKLPIDAGIRYSQINFTLRAMFPKWSDWTATYTRKGLRKRRLRTLSRWCTVLAVIISVAFLRQNGFSLEDLKDSCREKARGSLLTLQSYLSRGFQSLLQRL